MGYAPQADSFVPNSAVDKLLDLVEPEAIAAAAAPPDMPEFRESPGAFARRMTLGAAFAIRKRPYVLPHLGWMSAEHLVSPARAKRRLAEPFYRSSQGLVAVSDDLEPEAILDAYRRGMFPFCHVRPMKWWSPEVRAILHRGEARVEKNTLRLVRQGKFRVTFDQDLAAVMRACAEPRAGKTPLTWITPQVMRAYWKLHQQGHVHSVEVWDTDGHLVGGAYGLAIGEVYFGESQFSAVRDASKVAIAVLHAHLDHWGFGLRDAKWMTEHLAGQGFHPISRDAFRRELDTRAWKPGHVGRWEVDPAVNAGAGKNGK